jgi:uncharacterized protein (TIGR00730 family)
MQRLCVFCGSNPGASPNYIEAARQIAKALVTRGLELVYGGGSIGVMGALADSVIEQGGKVIGIIPRPLWDREVGHGGLTELRLVKTIHERKALMTELADGFIALPGGIGTLEEFFEIWTWAQLGIHTKPCGLLNVSGYFDSLLAFLEHAVSEKFILDRHREMVLVEANVETLLERLMAYRAPDVPKWLDRGEI